MGNARDGGGWPWPDTGGQKPDCFGYNSAIYFVGDQAKSNFGQHIWLNTFRLLMVLFLQDHCHGHM